MRSASYQSSSDPREVRRRAIALSLTIAIHVIVLLLLLWQHSPVPLSMSMPSDLSTFNVNPGPQEAAKASKSKVAKAKQDPAKAAPKPPTPTKPVKPPPITLPGVIPMDLASSDISKMPKYATDSSESGANGATDGKDAVAAYGPGAGPGGARLFNAEWVREPSDAELRYYMPKTGVPSGSTADIACKTIANNRVENCQSLGESPNGSGLARGMRQAAWQFLIRPPRVGGRPMLGEWVRIHFSFTDRGAEAH